MFKKLILATLCSVAVMSGAQAADSVDLKVTGTLTSGSCTPTLENGGVVDFGHIPLGNLSKTETNQIGSKKTSLTIECTSAMKVGWTVIDNSVDSETDLTIVDQYGSLGPTEHNLFGLGMTAGSVKIGSWSLRVLEAGLVADGSPAWLLHRDSKTQSADVVWNHRGEFVNDLNSNFRALTVGTVSGDLFPIAFKKASFPLFISAAVQGTDTLAITDETPMAGSATISLVYL